MGRIDTETKAYMSDPSRFADAFNYLIYGGQPVIEYEGKADMCQAIREMREESMAVGRAAGLTEGMQQGMQKGMQKGMQQGIQKGMLQGRLEAYAEMAAAGEIDVRLAAEKCRMTVEEFSRKTGINLPKN